MAGRAPKLPSNPKAKLGAKKLNLFLLPPVAMAHMASGMMNGELKFGPYKFRETTIEASVYIAACKRHLDLWADGEEKAEDSGVHHLGHAMACLAIILDAQAYGNLIDDRAKTGVLGGVINDILVSMRERLPNAQSIRKL